MKSFIPVICLVLSVLLINVLASPSSRIIGGHDARTGQFPYAAAIYVDIPGARLFCAGSLISNEWILTAGQCVNGAVLFTIVLGSIHLNSTDSSVVKLATSHYEIHPDFNPFTLENDIGLIKLRQPLPYSEYIQRVLLAYGPLNDDTSLVAIGWGATNDEVPELSNNLKYVNLVSLSIDECKVVYGDQINDHMLCVAGEYNEGTCRDDVGGPLLEYQSISRSIRHVGIASFISGNGCESIDPSGFTKTYSFRDWIRNVTSI